MAAIMLLLLAACAGLPVALPVTPVAVDEAAAVRLVSAYRAQSGLGAVEIDARLMRAAEAQALAMARRDKVGHNVEGALPRRLAAHGYDWSATAENVGAGYASLEAAMKGWRDSPGHRKNLLNAGVTEIGIAAAHAPGSTYGTYWALILAAPRERPGIGWGG